MSDLEKMKDAAGKAFGDASKASNAAVQSQAHRLPTIQKVGIGIAIFVVLAALIHWVS